MEFFTNKFKGGTWNKKFILAFHFAVIITINGMAQLPRYYQNAPKNNNGNLMTVDMLFGGHGSAADLGDRYGGFMSTGLGVDYITTNDFIIGGQGMILFGSTVKEDVIANVRNEDGLLFGDEGGIADIGLRQRGLKFDLHVGKIFRFKEESRSGIRATIGGGFFQHKIRIQDDPQVYVSQLNKEYKKGYDRLSNGIGITEFIGYQHLGKYRRVNFFIGVELTQAFTKNRRSFNFDTISANNDSRFDFSYGVRFGWILPFYLGEEASEIRY